MAHCSRKIFNGIDEKISFQYDGYDYTGIEGVLDLIKILEIGGGAKPHCSVVKLNNLKEYWINTSSEISKHNPGWAWRLGHVTDPEGTAG